MMLGVQTGILILIENPFPLSVPTINKIIMERIMMESQPGNKSHFSSTNGDNI